MTESMYYTRRGDDGHTGIIGPERVPKDDPQPEAYGTVDEAQAALGLVRAAGCTAATDGILLAIQRDLYTLMSELAAAGDAASPFAGRITPAHVDQLESWIAAAEADLEMPADFVIPGDSPPGAALHLARTIARRAERTVVPLLRQGLIANCEVGRYLNRLSSLLFVLACFEDLAHASTRGEASRPTLAREGS